jgi:hypothetical protein
VALANGDRRNYLLPLPPGEISQGGNHRDRYLEQQQTEKIETKVSDVYRIRIIESVRMLSRVAFWGGHKSIPVKHNKLVLFPPACSFPLITEALSGIWPGRYMRMDSP